MVFIFPLNWRDKQIYSVTWSCGESSKHKGLNDLKYRQQQSVRRLALIVLLHYKNEEAPSRVTDQVIFPLWPFGLINPHWCCWCLHSRCCSNKEAAVWQWWEQQLSFLVSSSCTIKLRLKLVLWAARPSSAFHLSPSLPSQRSNSSFPGLWKTDDWNWLIQIGDQSSSKIDLKSLTGVFSVKGEVCLSSASLRSFQATAERSPANTVRKVPNFHLICSRREESTGTLEIIEVIVLRLLCQALIITGLLLPPGRWTAPVL